MRARKRLAVGLISGAALLVPAASLAQRAEITQQVFDDDGLPVLVANPVPDGGKGRVIAWRMWAPGMSCQAIALDGRDDRSIEPGDVPAGTVFEVDVAADDGARTTARSAPWRGPVTASSAAAVSGRLQVGRLVEPLAAGWVGGWGGEDDLLRLEACTDETAMRCETLSAQGEDPPVCPGAAAVIGRRYEHWWVRAVDARIARDTAFAGVGYTRPRDIPLARPSRTIVRSELVGPIVAADGPFAECVAPRIRIPARARHRVLAYVECTSACDVLLTVRDARRTIRRRSEGGAIRLPRKTRVVGRRVDVRILVNGRHRAHRRVRLR